jgi:CRISPR-associated protein Cmr2
MTERLLHFTLGPVQGFVAQARRTRDLWAGSFLLSWLAGHAMKVVVENGGEILLPDVGQDALFVAVRSGASGFGPAIGSLPNRFKAKVLVEFNPVLCRRAVHKAWSDLAGKVWKRFVEPVAGQGNGTQAIWDRQVMCFWETAWVIGPADGQDHAWLDRRKNWRTHRPPVESGDHCMLMGDWQELSGFVRSRDRKRQDEFWHALKAHVDKESDNPLQLDESERLCAMALIKRLFFPHVANEVLGWTPSWDGQKPLRWPSTSRLAATGWLRCAWEKAPEEAEALVRLLPSDRSIEPELDPGNRLSQVPGALLHRSGIENARPHELAGSDSDAEATRGKLLNAYDALTKKLGKAEKARRPSAFYALLLMDGDRVGTLLHSQESNVTKGLARFSSQVDATVRQHGGNTIYAGGDDVLALLPLEGAIPAALALRKAYRGAFAEIPAATISAALVFAHFHVPLRHVLREAHRQLDDVAKDGNGCGSLAVCVLTQSGVTREWVSTWEDRDQRYSPPLKLDIFARELDANTSSRFFYSFDARYRDIFKSAHDLVADENDLRKILRSEYSASGAAERRTGESDTDHARRIENYIDQLLQLAKLHTRPDSPKAKESPPISMDGPLIARFLARETRQA